MDRVLAMEDAQFICMTRWLQYLRGTCLVGNGSYVQKLHSPEAVTHLLSQFESNPKLIKLIESLGLRMLGEGCYIAAVLTRRVKRDYAALIINTRSNPIHRTIWGHNLSREKFTLIMLRELLQRAQQRENHE